MNCPNCQQEITPVDGGFTPHFNRDNMSPDETPEQLTARFTCTKDARVIDPLKGDLSPVENEPPIPIQVQPSNTAQGEISVTNPDSIAASTVPTN